MTEFVIVEGKSWHCGQILHRLRGAHTKALLRVGFNSHAQLRDRFDDSAYRRAWLIDGKLAGLGGVTGPAMSTMGMIWLALTEDATKHPVEIIREARRQLAYICRTRRELLTLVLDDDARTRRFAEFLGFQPLSDYRVPIGGAFATSMRYMEAA